MAPNHHSLAVIKSCCKSATNISQKQEQMFFLQPGNDENLTIP